MNKKEYISLREATKYCSYSQEYLSLRARQRKLKAVKFGNVWMTKKEWVEEYLNKMRKYKENRVSAGSKRLNAKTLERKQPKPVIFQKPEMIVYQSHFEIAILLAFLSLFLSVIFFNTDLLIGGGRILNNLAEKTSEEMLVFSDSLKMVWPTMTSLKVSLDDYKLAYFQLPRELRIDEEKISSSVLSAKISTKELTHSFREYFTWIGGGLKKVGIWLTETFSYED